MAVAVLFLLVVHDFVSYCRIFEDGVGCWAVGDGRGAGFAGSLAVSSDLSGGHDAGGFGVAV